MRKKYLTVSPARTKEIAKGLAENFLKKRPVRHTFIIGLKGDLGGGKTTFLQGFGKGLGAKGKITSPTFVIAKRFKIPQSQKNRAGFKNFYHFDCYRIKNSKEILNLDFIKIFSDPQNIVAIEWPERIKRVLPRGVSLILIGFKFLDKKKREIILKIKNAK